MDAARQESILKKRLQVFLTELLKFGTIKGFKNFAMYLRGREELVISVLNEPKSSQYIHTLEHVKSASTFKDPNRSGSLTSNNLPYDKRSLLISMRSQMNLTTAAVPKGVGLPPASPSDSETQPGDETSTLFLIAGYARYSCPYVWIRSNHQRLVKLMGEVETEKDSPLRLKSTASWKDRNVTLYDIIAELVKLNTYPAPQNPYELDMEYFSSLPPAERVLETAAMIQTLKKWKGGSGVSCYLFRHVSNHQRIYKKCSTKTRNVANALKHLYQSIFIKNIFNARPWSRFS
uniref:DUF7886 domain-containing protein n=1 Tax=Magallana gigas TaxID=29159 RepID=K1PTE5_MAGGI